MCFGCSDLLQGDKGVNIVFRMVVNQVLMIEGVVYCIFNLLGIEVVVGVGSVSGCVKVVYGKCLCCLFVQWCNICFYGDVCVGICRVVYWQCQIDFIFYQLKIQLLQCVQLDGVVGGDFCLYL